MPITLGREASSKDITEELEIIKLAKQGLHCSPNQQGCTLNKK
jgi:hypothetical protein